MTYQEFLKTPTDRRTALGFNKGYILVIANAITAEEIDICKVSNARFNTKVGWYLPSGEQIPKLFPRARFIYLTFEEFEANEKNLIPYLRSKPYFSRENLKIK